MSKQLGYLAVAAALTMGALFPAQAQAPAALPAIADFFKDPQMRNPVLSEDGKYAAVTLRTKDGEVLAVVELANPKNTKIVAGFGDAAIGSYSWVGSERLVYSSRPTETGDVRNLHGSGLWSIARDGSDQRVLVQPKFGQRSGGSGSGTRGVDRSLDPDWALFGVPRDDSGDVLMIQGKWDTANKLVNVRLARLNAGSGILRYVDEGAPPRVQQWAVDVKGRPWAAMTSKDDREAIYLKDAQGAWKVWQEGEGTETYKLDSPFWSNGEGLTLVQGPTAEGTSALFRLDPSTGKREPAPLISTKGYDFLGSVVYDQASKRVLGVNYLTDAQGTAWMDPQMKAMQAAVDKLLPGRANILQCKDCLQAKTVLVTSFSDVQPEEFYLLDVTSNRLQMIGASRPWIKPEQMGRRDQVRIQARDGLEFPVLITQPPGKAQGPRPAVVLVHGGPYVRGTYWNWDSAAQFLASRGYVVIEPEFRGSQGYGWNLFRAGWKQWGLAMQDDVTDSLQWAVKKGWVDPKRVCIAGASYGGYATLMGMIKDPDLYQCGIDWVGVTDIAYLDSIHWSDTGDEYKKYGFKRLVGDVDADAAQLKNTSPLQRAAELKKPLILAYGGEDVRVPMKHGVDFHAAVERGGNKNVEWIFYAKEGHGWRILENNVDFWGRVEKFLDRNIGAKTTAQ